MPKIRPPKQQVKTVPVSAKRIMARKAFRLGFEDQRAGRKPRYDEERSVNDSWDYERGRQFAIVAPAKLQLRLPRSRQLNPKAIALFAANGDIR